MHTGGFFFFFYPMLSYVIQGRRNCEVPQTGWRKFQSHERLLWWIVADQESANVKSCRTGFSVKRKSWRRIVGCLKGDFGEMWWLLTWIEKQFRSFRLWIFYVSYIFFLIKTHEESVINNCWCLKQLFQQVDKKFKVISKLHAIILLGAFIDF